MRGAGLGPTSPSGLIWCHWCPWRLGNACDVPDAAAWDVCTREAPPRSSWADARGGPCWVMPEASLLMVSGDVERVESELSAGRFRCSCCDDRLAPSGRARSRRVRSAGGVVRRVQPRRASCVGCEHTHVVLPDRLLVRRRDEVVLLALSEVPQVCSPKYPTCEVWSTQRVAGAGGGAAEEPVEG